MDERAQSTTDPMDMFPSEDTDDEPLCGVESNPSFNFEPGEEGRET